MKLILKILLPLVVVAVSLAGAVVIINSKPAVETQRPAVMPPLVRVTQVRSTRRTLSVTSQGTVMPRTESGIVPEVSGRIVVVAPAFASGGFFEKGDVLIKIDPSDYEQALAQARTEVAAQRLRVAQEEAEADVARREWDEVGEGEAPPLTLRLPHLENARCALVAAEALFERAERDLQRTEIRAPYACRVRQKQVDLGQFVTRGSTIAVVYAVDYAEIRLPLADSELAFLDLPLHYRGEAAAAMGPAVTVRSDFAGKTFVWQGRVVRTEGEIDALSRMIHVVARVKDPYGRGSDPDRPPLAVGMFVEGEIEGLSFESVCVLPRAALRDRSRVFVVDGERRLRFRDVEILRATRSEIVIRAGLEDGELVCLSPLEAVTDGMQVRADAFTPGFTPAGTEPAERAQDDQSPGAEGSSS